MALFEARIKNPILLKKVVFFFSRQDSDIPIRIKKDGIHITEMDYSHVTLASFLYPKEQFQAWKLERPIEIMFNSKLLNDIFQKMKHTDIVDLKIDDSGDLQAIIKNEEYERFFSIRESPQEQFEHEFPIIEGYDGKEVHKITFNKPEHFFMGLKDAEYAGDAIRLSFKDSFFLMESLMESYPSNRRTFLKISTKKEIVKIEKSLKFKETKTLFPIHYLKQLDHKKSKIRVQSENMTIKYKPEMPMLLEFKIRNGGHFKLYIAPRVEEEKQDEEEGEYW